MGSKKAFDREKMYRKIMPTYYENDTEDQDENVADPEVPKPLEFRKSDPVVEEEEPTNSLLEHKEINRVQDRDNKVILYNITESMVLAKLDMVMGGMNCCKCDRCKMDIIAMSLNSLSPHYVVGTKNAIDLKVQDSDMGQQVTSAVLKAALAVRKQPRH